MAVWSVYFGPAPTHPELEAIMSERPFRFVRPEDCPQSHAGLSSGSTTDDIAIELSL